MQVIQGLVIKNCHTMIYVLKILAGFEAIKCYHSNPYNKRILSLCTELPFWRCAWQLFESRLKDAVKKGIRYVLIHAYKN